MQPEHDAYKVLQVDPAADAAVIRAAYRALARRFHPDGLEPDPARMARLNRAYALVREPGSRRFYDAGRTSGQRQPVGPGGIDPWRRTGPVGDGSPSILDFGRYAGWRLADLVRTDPDYLRWLSRHSSGLRFRDQIARLLPHEPDLVRRANSVA